MKYYFSRRPGEFVNELTGEIIYGTSFTGTVREWYEMLAYFVSRKAKEIFKNNDLFEVIVSPDVLTILQCTLMMSLIKDESSSTLKFFDNKIKVNNEYIASMDRNQTRNILTVQHPQTQEKFEIEIKHLDII